MRIIALEEHFVTPEIVSAWRALDPRWQDLALAASSQGDSGRRLLDLGEDRLAAMDAAGIDVQVISLTSPGVQNLAPADAVSQAAAANDALADAVRGRPDRFQGLAALSTPSPERAATELARAIVELQLDGAILFGRTRDQNLDDRKLTPIFEVAAALHAPLYLHPQSPPPAVRAAYYDGLGDPLDAAFATHGLGWHYETGVQLLRLILSGTLDRYPDLQLVTGHWGEVVLFYLERAAPLAAAAKLQRPLADYIRDNVWITPSGMLSSRYLRWALEVVGLDRLLFATDYPFVPQQPGAARDFLARAGLSGEAQRRIASGNWERLRAAISR